MNFRKSRLRRIEQSMVTMGITGKPEVVINILVFKAPKKPRAEKLPREKHVDAEEARKPPTPEPQEHMAPEKKRRRVLHCYFDDSDHVVWPGDANYEEILRAAPGDRPRLLGRQEGRNRGPVQYRKVMLA